MTQDEQNRRRRDRYSRRRARNARRDREETAAGKEIGPLPEVRDPVRKARCRLDLRRFLLTYRKEAYPLPFSDDHEEFIAAIQEAILKGGNRAQAMPRGSGKTTIILDAIGWAHAYGHRKFVVLGAAEQEAADELAEEYRTIWETSDDLLADFPEIAYPIRQLEGTNNRAAAQTLAGRRTFIRWSGSKLRLPTVTDSPASGSVLRAKGILGRLRGMKATTPDGETIRPDLLLIEDFQTDASAQSDVQCAKREKVIAGAALGLAGPGKRIAAFATCTVIRWGDTADRILNRKIYPRWRGKRCQLVNTWPADYERGGPHWRKYTELREAELDEGIDEHPKATAYYKRHRRAMDLGADIPWKERKYPHELSAIEHAVNLRHDNPDTFDAEYQNEPKDDAAELSGLRTLGSDEIITATHGQRRGIIPDQAAALTVGIDVQKDVLFYLVAATAPEDFTGQVIDYGWWPKQPTPYFSASDVPRTIEKETGLAGAAAIHEALTQLKTQLFQAEYKTADGLSQKIERGLVDAGYETHTVYQWTRETEAPLMACMGYGVTARQVPWDQIKAKRGERFGFGWRIPATAKTNSARRVDIDTNTWKTDLLQRIALPPASPGRWSLYQRTPTAHRLIGDHLSAEYPTLTSGRGRELYEWALRPGRENHLLDCLVYAAVAANLSGINHPKQPKKTRKRAPKNHRDGWKRTAAAAKAKPAGGSLAEKRAAKRRGNV